MVPSVLEQLVSRFIIPTPVVGVHLMYQSMLRSKHTLELFWNVPPSEGQSSIKLSRDQWVLVIAQRSMRLYHVMSPNLPKTYRQIMNVQ
jgi:hypothetical protein